MNAVEMLAAQPGPVDVPNGRPGFYLVAGDGRSGLIGPYDAVASAAQDASLLPAGRAAGIVKGTPLLRLEALQ